MNHRRLRASLSAACLVVAVPHAAFAETAAAENAVDLKQIQKEVKALYDAVMNGDTDVIVPMTNEELTQIMGGPKKVAAAAKANAEQFKTLQFGVESFEFPKPPEVVQGSEKTYVVVNIKTVNTIQGTKRIAMTSAFIGCQDASGKWRYCDTNNLRELQKQVPEFMADLPKDYELPKTVATPLQ